MSIIIDSNNNIVVTSTELENTVLESIIPVLVENTEYNTVQVSTEHTTVVTNNNTDLVVSSSGSQGPQGIQGESLTSVTYIAGEPLGGNRVVSVNALGTLVYPDLSSYTNILGITISSANLGATVEVQIVGTMTEPSWNWVPDYPIYAGTNGLLTQTPPESGLLYVVGYAITPNKIFIDKQQPILLG